MWQLDTMKKVNTGSGIHTVLCDLQLNEVDKTSATD
jgi:hypothetical protein